MHKEFLPTGKKKMKNHKEEMGKEKEKQVVFTHRKRIFTSLMRKVQNKILKCYLEHLFRW